MWLQEGLLGHCCSFVTRSFGGEVTWDADDAAGSRFEESDDSITHQIVDRPLQKHRFISR